MSQMIDMQTGAQQAPTPLQLQAFKSIGKYRVCSPSNTFKKMIQFLPNPCILIASCFIKYCVNYKGKTVSIDYTTLIILNLKRHWVKLKQKCSID